MKLKLLTISCILLLLLTVSVFGATVGKIKGTVTDAETGEPLVGVTVAVQGTTWGAVTNEDGEYNILNVPVGNYTVVFSAVGYATLELSNVSVHADLVTYESHALLSQVQELGTTIKVRSETPMVIEDKTTTVNIVSREELRALPTRGFEQVVGIQNSVVRMNSNVDIRQRGGREALATAPEINLRGGRPSEVAYYVDGFSQQDPLSGISTANISNNAIQEVAVQSGTFSAEYGHVASGIVQVTTNSGTDEYHATVEAVSDNLIGENKFDQNFYSADLGGPIPGLEKGFFYLSGERRYLGDRSPSSTAGEVFEEFGIDNDGSEMLPNNSLSGWSYQGKIDYNFSPNLKLTLNGNGSLDYWQEYRHYFFNPEFPEQVEHSPRYRDENLGLNAKITHTLNANTFYNLSASYFKTERLRGDGVVFDDYSAYNRGITNPEYDSHNLFRQGRVDTVVTGTDTSFNYVASYWQSYLQRISSYYGFKGDITSQVNSNSTLKLGFDFQRHTLRYYEDLDATKAYNSTRVNRYGFNDQGEESDSEDFRNDTKNPINLGLYVQNRLDWRGLIVNAGVRFDYFDYKALRLKNIHQPTDPDNPDPAAGLADNTIDLEDLEDSEKFTRVSPRLGISFPVSDKTQMHINYGKFFQRPDLRRLYAGYDFIEARISAGSYYPFPSPNLEPEKVTQYEFGMTHQLGDNTAFEVVAYYKDVEDLTQIFHITPAFPTAYDVFANTDFGTIKGFDFSFNMRRTRNIALQLKYSLSYATGTGSYAQSQFNIAWKNAQGAPKQTFPLDYDQRHSIIGMFDYRTGAGQGPLIGDIHPLENFGLNILAQFASGTPYTPMNPYDGVSPNASVQQEPTGSINSANLPWQFQVDMKLERTFDAGRFQLIPYIWVKNLLDRENVVGVYEGTGKANTSGYLETSEGQTRASDPTTGSEFAYRYDYGQNNPKNYSMPREIFLGLRVSF